MRRHTINALLGGLAGAAAILALDARAQQPDESKFLQDAIRGNVAEVKMGELAMQRGQSKDVRNYGEMLVNDHKKANDKAMAIAKEMNLAVPTEPTAKAMQEHESLSKLSGSEFDTVFMSRMAQGHQEEVAKFSEQAQSGGSTKITEYAKDTLPTLRKHLEKAQSVQAELTSSTERGSRSKGSGAESGSGSSTSGAGNTRVGRSGGDRPRG